MAENRLNGEWTRMDADLVSTIVTELLTLKSEATFRYDVDRQRVWAALTESCCGHRPAWHNGTLCAQCPRDAKFHDYRMANPDARRNFFYVGSAHYLLIRHRNFRRDHEGGP